MPGACRRARRPPGVVHPLAAACALLAAVAVVSVSAADGDGGQWDAVLGAVGDGRIQVPTGARLLAPAGLVFPGFSMSGDAVLALNSVYVEDHSSLKPSDAGNLEFPQALALGWLGRAERAALNSVRVNTSCAVVRELQELACTTLPDYLVGNFQITPGYLQVPSWDSDNLSATNVEVFCGEQQTGPLLNCSVAHVRTWDELVTQSRALQLTALQVHIMLDTNMSVPFNFSGTVADGEGERDPARSIEVYRRMRVAPSPDLSSRLVYMSLGYIQGEGLWRMMRPTGQLKFENLTFLTLPLGPISKYPMSVLPWGMWNVEMDRCDPIPGMLVLQQCRLITQSETMDYVSYWAGESLSVFPDRAEAAEWYGQDTTCNPIQNRSLLSQQISLRDQNTWVATNVSVLGVSMFDTTLTSKLPAGLRHTQPGLQITRLFSDPYTPFPDITWVATPRQLVRALTTQATPNIVILTNVSVAASLWPREGVTLQRDMSISGWPSRPTVVDWQGVSGVVNVGRHSLQLRNMVLLNGGQGGPRAQPAWAANLTMYQWPIVHPWGSTSLQLEAVTLIVPPTEFQILKRNSRAAGVTPLVPQLNSLTWLQTTTVWATEDNTCTVPMIVEDGFLGFNMTITDKPVAFAALPTNVQLVGSDPTGGDTGRSPASDRSPLPWKLILAVVLPVVLGAMVLLGGFGFMLYHRRVVPNTSNPFCLPLRKHDAESQHDGLSKTSGSPRAGEGGGKLEADSQGAARSDGGSGDGVPAGHCRTNSGQPLLPGGTARSMLFTTPLSSELRSVAPLGSEPGSSGWPSGVLPMARGAGSVWGASGTADLSHRQARLTHGVDPAGGASRPHSHTGSVQYGLATVATTGAVARGGVRTPGGITPRASGATPGSAPTLGGAPGSAGWACGTPRTPGSHAAAMAGVYGSASGGLMGVSGPHTAKGSLSTATLDSFDVAPQDLDQLLINQLNMSRDLREAAAAPDVAQQLKAMVARMQDELGDQEVIVTRVIGHGGGGVVYQGVWRGLTVAVKTLVFSVVPSQPMTRRQQRAMTEAAICRTLQHPNIVATYSHELQALTSARAQQGAATPPAHPGSAGHSTGTNNPASHGSASDLASPGLLSTSTAAEYKLYIIQEYCDGGTLRSIIDEGRLHVANREVDQPPNPLMGHIIQLAADIAAGMAHVHSRNIVHGDLTPSNVLLRINPQTHSRYTAKVADFGLSWKLASGQEHVSNAAQGTAFYIAPEVLHVGIMSKAADVWCFGLLLHEMFHGTPAWRKGRVNLQEAAHAATTRPRLDQLQWSPSCPEWLRGLVTMCLSPDPKARPSFRDIAAQLTALAEARAQAGADAISALTRSREVLSGDLSSMSSVPGAGGGNTVLAPVDPGLAGTAAALILAPLPGSPGAPPVSSVGAWPSAYVRADSDVVTTGVVRGSELYPALSLSGLLGIPLPSVALQPASSQAWPVQAATDAMDAAAAAGATGAAQPVAPTDSTTTPALSGQQQGSGEAEGIHHRAGEGRQPSLQVLPEGAPATPPLSASGGVPSAPGQAAPGAQGDIAWVAPPFRRACSSPSGGGASDSHCSHSHTTGVAPVPGGDRLTFSGEERVQGAGSPLCTVSVGPVSHSTMSVDATPSAWLAEARGNAGEPQLPASVFLSHAPTADSSEHSSGPLATPPVFTPGAMSSPGGLGEGLGEQPVLSLPLLPGQHEESPAQAWLQTVLFPLSPATTQDASGSSGDVRINVMGSSPEVGAGADVACVRPCTGEP